jgi:hypothetical protein
MGEAKRRKPVMEEAHYLATMYVSGGNAHAYVAWRGSPRRSTEAAEHLEHALKTIGVPTTIPAVLLTKLTGGEDVRDLLKAMQGDVSPIEKFASGKEDYVKAIWTMPECDPANVKLMELH